MRTFVKGSVAALAAVSLALAPVGVAAADTVTNSVGSGVTLTVGQGQSVTVAFKLNPTSAAGDTPGCNAAGGSG